jgi:hypothetical protein
MTDKIKIEGLREFQRALKDAEAGTPKMLRDVLNAAVGEVIDYARPRIPKRTGRAAASLKARSSQRAARLAMGGQKAPYMPWLDFGGEGKRRGRPAPRPFIREGRYVYHALAVRKVEITQIMADGMTELARTAGLEVS